MSNKSDKLIKWINEKLIEEGWTIRELARRAKLSPTTIGDFLNHKTKAGLQFCIGIARAFRVPTETILRLAGHLPQLTEDVMMNEELLTYFTALPKSERRRILTIVRALHEEHAKYETSTPRTKGDRAK